MKYSFILEIDDISKDDINELVNILSDNKIKFHVLKSDKELKENQKYKEVINKAINELERGIEFCKNDSQELYNSCNIAIFREESILKILKEVEHE